MIIADARRSCSVTKGCQANCTEQPNFPEPPPKSESLSTGEIVGIVLGALSTLTTVFTVFHTFVRVKAIHKLRRPFALYEIYGIWGIALLVFGSRTTWRIEAYVLARLDDENALSFKKSIQDECTMISIAVSFPISRCPEYDTT